MDNQENPSSQRISVLGGSDDTPPTPPIKVVNGEAKKSSGAGKKILKVFLTIIILAGIGAGGYLYWQEKSDNKRLNNQVSDLNSQVSQLNKESAGRGDQQVQALSNNYKSKEGLFSLAVPEGNKIADVQPAKNDVADDNKTIRLYVMQAPELGDGNLESIELVGLYSVLANGQSIQDLQKGDKPGAAISEANGYKKQKDIQISGVTAEVYKKSDSTSTLMQVFFKKDDRLFWISGSYKNDAAKDSYLIDEVIRGFKFD